MRQVVVLRAQDALGEQVVDVLPRLVEAEPGGDGVLRFDGRPAESDGR